MSDNTDGLNGGINSGINGNSNHAGSFDDGINAITESSDNIDATNDTIGGSTDNDHNVNAANGTNSAQGEDVFNSGQIGQEFRLRFQTGWSAGRGIVWILLGLGPRECQKSDRCPDCNRLWVDTLLLRVSRALAEEQAQTEQTGAISERCRTCLRLWVVHDHLPRDLEQDNHPGMVRSELGLFTDLEELLARSAAAPAAPVPVAGPSADENIYGTSGADADDEADD